MFLHSVEITRLRSVDRAELKPCGKFNILIGKNNSGKSNILAAIRGFFSAFKANGLVNLEPMFTGDEDFFNRDSQLPIEITCTFRLREEESSEIVSSIEAELPQIGSAVASLGTIKSLSVTLKYFSKPFTFSLISKMLLGVGQATEAIDTLIFEIPNEIAPQIHSTAYEKKQKKDEAEFYGRVLALVDEDDFRRAKTEKAGSFPFRYLLDRVVRGISQPVTSDFLSTLQEEINSSSNF